MKSYVYGKPKGRVIGKIGDYTLYPKSLSKEKSKPVEDIEIDNTAFKFIYGPSAGGLLESIQFSILTSGEYIKNMSADPLFKNRNLKVINKNIEDVIPIIERVNGPFSASHSIAFLSAVEDAMEIEVDNNILMGRIIELELERIRNHLHVVARTCESAAFGVPYNNLFYLREKINRIIYNYTGHRFFYGINTLKTFNKDFTGISKPLRKIGKETQDTYESLLESKIFVDRLLDNGIVTDSKCTGPVARGCGHKYDARTDSDTLPYDDIDFSPVVEDEGVGDAMNRFMVRFEEILKSIEIIENAEKKTNKHRMDHINNINGMCEGVGRVESPSGDIAYYVEIEDMKINKINLLTSSKTNLPVFLKSTRGNVFTDFHFNWESFGIWISEIAVNFI